MVCDYEYDDEKQTMTINCMGCIFSSSIEDQEVCMAKTIDKLREIKKIPRIIFSGVREYEYNFYEAKLLFEIAMAIENIYAKRIITLENISECEKCAPARYQFLQAVMNDMRYDPVECYKKILREIRHTNIKKERDVLHQSCYDRYLNNALIPIKNILESCELIQLAKTNLYEYKGREFYRRIFHPTVRPNFMYTRYISIPPQDAELLQRYELESKGGKTTIEIYQIPGKIRKLYHMIPPEFRLNEEEYSLLDEARRYIGRHEPRETELQEPQSVRENLFRIGYDMIKDLARTKGLILSEDRLNKLADILTRYTAGFGILELILQDENVQDIEINSPIGRAPIFIFHGEHAECETNIVSSIEDADSWATRFRLMSGRPLDEANPVLDTELQVPGGRARIAAITRTLSPDGLGFALRRHRDRPWTMPLMIKNRMLDSFSAGLIWFLIDGARTMLIGGTRSSGKTSFLGACMVQIMPKLRIITVEDTLELPVEALRELGYNIERLKSRSVITRVETELPAEEALRTALRLGDSCLIVGEVRSKEALALYEAMRIGALANVVAGTIHGDSAYGVFDRVVNDLGVPPTSFKATDVIMICNMLKSADGLHSFRRLIELTEVRKHWKVDPVDEGGFVNLLEYSAIDDVLKPTKTLLTGESEVLNSIAYRVREWRGNWNAVWNNIKLRGRILQTLVDYSSVKPNLLEADVVMESNSMFHLICDEVKKEVGELNTTMIFDRWSEWLKKKIE